MKKSEFQQTVLMAIDKINIKIDKMDTEFKDFKNYVIEKFDKQEKFNQEQKNFNESFSNRLDSIQKRLAKLESFYEKDIKRY